jgi:hypothetical protein
MKRNTLRGDSLNNVDLTVGKNVMINETEEELQSAPGEEAT